MKTIFILSPDRATYAKWFDQYGFKLVNVEMSYLHNKEEMKGYPYNDTFFTIIGDVEDSFDLLDHLKKRFRYIPKEKLEQAVKGRKSRRVRA